jgi:hypothetical protein
MGSLAALRRLRTRGYTGLVASRTANHQVVLTWNAVGGAGAYQIERTSGSGFVLHGTSSTTTFSDAQVGCGEAYAYRIRATDAGGGSVSPPSAHDLAIVIAFTSVLPNMAVADEPLHELLGAINAIRRAGGYGNTSWTAILQSPGGGLPVPPPPGPGAVVYGEHIAALRRAMDAARAALLLPNAPYPDPNLTNLTIKASHITDLQERAQ